MVLFLHPFQITVAMIKKPLFTLCCLLFLSNGYAQINITNADGSLITTRYCYANQNTQIIGTPTGGSFSGCGMSLQNGQWVFNPVQATQGVTVFPYSCPITYTASNGQSTTRNFLVQKPVVIDPPLQGFGTCIDSVRIEATMLYAGAYDFEWIPSSPLSRPDTSLTDAFVTQTTTFYLTATDKVGGCKGKDSITIIRYPVPQLSVNPEQAGMYARQSVQLQAEGATYYEWFPKQWLSHAGIANPVASPKAPIEYTVVGYNEFECTDTAKVRIDIDEQVYLPNAFTPNGDGLNDFFAIRNMGYQGVLSFRIYNRWGQLVFETLDAARGWDGMHKNQPAEQGNYFYDIRLSLRDGSSKHFKGEVLLIR